MSYFKGKNKEFSFRDLIYKALIFIGTVGVIVYFLPRDGKFNYQFDIDKPWKYGQLMATFDFPIYKDDQVVKREQDSILASFQPYFQLDKNTEKEVIKKLKNDYQTHLRDVLPSTDYIRHIEKILSEVYRAGILSTEELGQLHKDSTSAIMVINDKLASQRDIDKLLFRQAGVCLSPHRRHHALPAEHTPAMLPQRIPVAQPHLRRPANRDRKERSPRQLLMGQRHRLERAENHRPGRDSQPRDLQHPRKPA